MNLALFDFDGTITDADMYTKFIRFSVSKRRLMLGSLLLSPFYLYYKLNLFAPAKLRVMVSYMAFFRRSFARVDLMGAEFARNTIPKHLRENALARIGWHKDNGDTIIVVSASLDIYLKHWCMELGIQLICSELGVVDGKLSGCYVAGDCSGDSKAERINARFTLEQYENIYAYGDTVEDLAMLDLAHEKYMNWQKLID